MLLNAGPLPQFELDGPLDVRLSLALGDLKARFIDLERGVVRYHAIRDSEEFQSYKDLTRRLQSFNLGTLKNRSQRLAFWVNIYNAAVIHGIIELGLKRSVKEFFHFFDRVAYEIGGLRFSLNDIEHGILRGNQRPPYRFFKPFRGKDPRGKVTITPMDPRIHFALVCGATSCPPVSFYEAEQIDFQLKLAAESFINSPRVQILPAENVLLISAIFKWYKTDFGGSDQTVIDTILAFLDEGETKRFLRDHRTRMRIRYQPYNWNLN